MKKVNSVTMQRTPNIPTVPKQRKGSLYQNQDKIQTPR